MQDPGDDVSDSEEKYPKEKKEAQLRDSLDYGDIKESPKDRDRRNSRDRDRRNSRDRDRRDSKDRDRKDSRDQDRRDSRDRDRRDSRDRDRKDLRDRDRRDSRDRDRRDSRDRDKRDWRDRDKRVSRETDRDSDQDRRDARPRDSRDAREPLDARESNRSEMGVVDEKPSESRTISMEPSPKRPKLPFKSPVSPERQLSTKQKVDTSRSETYNPFDKPGVPEKSAMEKAGFAKFNIKKTLPVRKPDTSEVDNSKISIKLSGKMLKPGNPLESYPPKTVPKMTGAVPSFTTNFMTKRLRPAAPLKSAMRTSSFLKDLPIHSSPDEQPVVVEQPVQPEQPVIDPKEVAEMRLLGIEPDFGNAARARPPPSLASSQIKPKTSMATTSASALFDIFFSGKPAPESIPLPPDVPPPKKEVGKNILFSVFDVQA